MPGVQPFSWRHRSAETPLGSGAGQGGSNPAWMATIQSFLSSHSEWDESSLEIKAFYLAF